MRIELWRETLAPYHLAVQELVVKFNHIIKECRESGNYSPIEAVNGRVNGYPAFWRRPKEKESHWISLQSRWTILPESGLSASLLKILIR